MSNKSLPYHITLTRQSLDERSSAYLCYDGVISVIEGHRSVKKSICIMKIFRHQG